MTKLRVLLTVGCAVLGLPLAAAQIDVTTTDDELNADGDCALREAVESANGDVAIDGCVAGDGADLIVLPRGTYTIAIDGRAEDENLTGDLDIGSEVTLLGSPSRPQTVVLDGAGLDRLIDASETADVTIDGVTIRNGDPGANAGGIDSEGRMMIRNSQILNNTGRKFGGGVQNAATGVMRIVQTTIAGNETLDIGQSGGGGGVNNYGTLTVVRSTITGNVSERGAGLYNPRGDLTVNTSTISGNFGLNGGGIFNIGRARIGHSVVAGNDADDFVGGIWSFGAIETILNRSIVSGNTSVNGGRDCDGTIFSRGYNVIADAAGCGFVAGPEDLLNVDPLLDTLGDNGGPTETHALLAGSPAIDLAPIEECVVEIDQRGLDRPMGQGCDSGAVEQY